MENVEKLAAALVKAQSAMKIAKKDSENPFFKSKYADLGSVWEACHSALSENEIAVVQSPVFLDGRFFLRTTLLHSSGQSISGDYLIKPVKEDPQAYGSAYTYARRYSLAAVLGIVEGLSDKKLRELSEALSGGGVMFRPVAPLDAARKSLAIDIVVDIMLLPPEAP